MLTTLLLCAALALADSGDTAAPDTTDADADGWTVDDGDCDDTNPQTHPGAAERCDGLDNQCRGALWDREADLDGDGFLACEDDCDDDDGAVHPDAAEAANSADDDCDGLVDEGTSNSDDDNDGWCERDGDCDDADPTLNPDADDPADGDGIDQDCDGRADEGDLDVDGDGDGYTPEEGDCDDDNAQVYRGADELPDGLDNDCDDVADVLYGTRSPCGGGAGKALLLLPLAGLLRRRNMAATAIFSAMLLATIPTARAGATDAYSAEPTAEEIFDEGLLQAEQKHRDLVVRAALSLDLTWAWEQWARIQSLRVRELDLELRAARQGLAGSQLDLVAAAVPMGPPLKRREARDRLEQAQKVADPDRIAALVAIRDAALAWETAWSEHPGTDVQQVVPLFLPALREGRIWLCTWMLGQVQYGPPTDDVRAALVAWGRTWGTEIPTFEERLVAGLWGYDAAPTAPSLGALESVVQRVSDGEKQVALLEATRAQLLEQLSPPGARPIPEEAAEVARDYSVLISVALQGDFVLSNDIWAALFWRGGTATLLAGDTENGWLMLRQAAAVSATPIPTAALSPSLVPWLSQASAEAARLGTGTLTLDADRAGLFTIDGVPYTQRPVTVALRPGLHRVTFQPEDDPMVVQTQAALVRADDTARAVFGPVTERDPELTLLQQPYLLDDAEPILREAVLPALPESLPVPPGPLRGLHAGVGATAVALADTVGGGPLVAARWGLDNVGLRAEGALINTRDLIPLTRDKDTQLVAHLSLGAEAAWRTGDLLWSGSAGGYWHPGLAYGLSASLGGGWQRPRGTLEISANGAYDLALHTTPVQRWSAGLGLVVWPGLTRSD